MAYEVRANMKTGAYYIFIAARTVAGTPVTLPLRAVVDAGGDATWKPVGVYKIGEAKAKSEADKIQLYDGSNFQTGASLKFEATSLESDAAKLTALEAFLNAKCDILCVKNDGTYAYIQYKGLNIEVNVDDKLSLKDVDAIAISGAVMGAKASDFKAQGSIAS